VISCFHASLPSQLNAILVRRPWLRLSKFEISVGGFRFPRPSQPGDHVAACDFDRHFDQTTSASIVFARSLRHAFRFVSDTPSGFDSCAFSASIRRVSRPDRLAMRLATRCAA
jgi:hypothetical protein